MITIAPVPDDDDDDWIDIERPATGHKLADVTARLSKLHAHKPARAVLTFRGPAAAWFEGAVRWRAQLGGNLANRVRVAPDNENGRFEAANMHGSRVLRLGVVTAWPNELRDITDCTWAIVGGCMVVTLPADWARARMAPQPVPVTAPAPPKRDAPPAFPITTSAPGLAGIAAERDELAERLRQRDDEDRADTIPAVIGETKLSPLERKVLALLVRRDHVSKTTILTATAKDGEDDDRDPKIADVIICKLRPKLAPLGVEIKTAWGEGYSISVTHRALLRKLFNAGRQTVSVGDPPGLSALDQRRAGR